MSVEESTTAAVSAVSETSATEATETPKGTPLFDAIPEALKVALAPLLADYLATNERAHAARNVARSAGDGLNEVIADLINTSDDPRIVELRTTIEANKAKIAAAEAKVKEQEAALFSVGAELAPKPEVSQDDANKAFADVKAELNVKAKALDGFFPGVLAEHLEANNISIAGGLRTSKGAGATGIKRPRLASATVDGVPIVDKDGKTSFTLIAAALKKQHIGATDFTAADLSGAAYAAAGVSDFETDQEVKFKYTVVGKNGGKDFAHDATIVVVSK